jgi:hypothetical protein
MVISIFSYSNHLDFSKNIHWYSSVKLFVNFQQFYFDETLKSVKTLLQFFTKYFGVSFIWFMTATSNFSNLLSELCLLYFNLLFDNFLAHQHLYFLQFGFYNYQKRKTRKREKKAVLRINTVLHILCDLLIFTHLSIFYYWISPDWYIYTHYFLFIINYYYYYSYFDLYSVSLY